MSILQKSSHKRSHYTQLKITLYWCHKGYLSKHQKNSEDNKETQLDREGKE